MSAAGERPLRVALLGSRGIPARYGGYETLMEELARRLVARGVEVTVYCRSHSTPRDLREHVGARLVVLPTLRGKHLDTPVHTLLACLHARGQGYDAALMVNSANAVFLPILRSAGIPVALNVDGLEKRRAKWGPWGRGVYAWSERLAPMLCDTLITDAEVIARHYLRRYGAASVEIPYGVAPQRLPPGETLERLGLQPRRYFLYVSRFEPENNPHRVAEAYRSVPGALPLVMVGGAPYAQGFIESFTRNADPRIRLPGPIYGAGYRELLSNALAYIQATEVGGTHPALVEAMGYGNYILAHDSPENREVGGDAVDYFNVHLPATLAQRLAELLPLANLRSPRLDERRTAAARRAADRYSWERITTAYLRVFRSLAGRSVGPSAAGM